MGSERLAISESELWSKALVINLEDRRDRLELFMDEFKSQVAVIHRVDAIKGAGDYTHLRQACTLSHLRALKLASALGYQYFLLFEDDACFNPLFDGDFSKALSELPEDFDMLYLGAWTTDFKPYSENLRQSEWSMLAHAILFSSRKIEMIIKHISENSYLGARPVDYLYGDLHLRLNVFTLASSMIIQRPSFSSIEQKYVDLSDKVNWRNNLTLPNG